MPVKRAIWFLFLLVTLSLPGFPLHAGDAGPCARNGVMDLTQWSPQRHGPVPLTGEWAFYWGKLLTPEDFRAVRQPEKTGWFTMPSVWNGVEVAGRKLGGNGFATFRLHLRLGPDSEPVALLIPYAFTAWRLWIDWQPAAAAGRVGETAEEMVPRYRTRVVYLDPPAGGEIVLTLQASNFMHAKGGLRDPIRLVAASQVSGIKHRALIKDVLVFGCLLIMAIYHLAIFAFRRPDRFNLYFALCCLLFGVRASLTGEVFLLDLFPGLSWFLTVRIEWLGVYMGPPLAVAFLQAYFPGECSRRVTHGSLAAGAVFSLVTLLAPPLAFTGMFPWLAPFIILLLLYCVLVLIRAVARKRRGAAMMLVSLIIVIVIVVNDILYANELIKTGHYIPYGMLFFVFSQALILAIRSSKTASQLQTTNNAYALEIRERKRVEAEVQAYQGKLEERVQQRTEELAVANQRLRQELEERSAAEKEKLELQNRLQGAKKMEALGTLAGGVAHDLNNILSGMVGYPDLLLQDLPPGSELRKPLETIRRSGQKAAAIVQDLLTLARRNVANFQVLDINRIISEYLCSPEFGKLIQFHPGVRVTSRLAPEMVTLRGSAVHLSKTVMNLVSNAAEAMPGGGEIRIRTELRKGIDTDVERGRAPQGEIVALVVQDDGIGISREDLERIFEPFYTKKVMGKSGTGLGMAVVWGTVKDHGGNIDVSSREGQGTTFTLLFPATRDLPGEAPATWSPADHRKTGESILVVDDVAEQREIATAMLGRLGYRVAAVSSGEAAVSHVSSQPVDLLLLDMIMEPGIDGLETYRRIVALYPQQKAVIASGYADTGRIHAARQMGQAKYLRKPYDLQKLAETITSVLELPAGSPDGDP